MSLNKPCFFLFVLSIHQVINFLPWGVVFKFRHDYQIIREKGHKCRIVVYYMQQVGA